MVVARGSERFPNNMVRSISLEDSARFAHDAGTKIEYLTEALDAARSIRRRDKRFSRISEIELDLLIESAFRDNAEREHPVGGEKETDSEILRDMLAKATSQRRAGEHPAAIAALSAAAEYADSKGMGPTAKTFRSEVVETFAAWGRIHMLRHQYETAMDIFTNGWEYADDHDMTAAMDRFETLAGFANNRIRREEG